MTYLLNNDKFSIEEAMKWEKDVFEDTVNKFNAGTLDYEYYLGENVGSTPTISVEARYLSERSIPDEL